MKRSAFDLFKTVVGVAGVMAGAHAMGMNVDFTKGTIGWKNHTIDVGGGMSWIPKLAARLIKPIVNKFSKDSEPDTYADKIKGGEQTAIWNSFQNRMTPAPSMLWDYFGTNKTRGGIDLTTFKGKEQELLEKGSPFTVQDLLQGINGKGMDEADAAAIIILASFGASTYTNDPKSTGRP